MTAVAGFLYQVVQGVGPARLLVGIAGGALAARADRHMESTVRGAAVGVAPLEALKVRSTGQLESIVVQGAQDLVPLRRLRRTTVQAASVGTWGDGGAGGWSSPRP